MEELVVTLDIVPLVLLVLIQHLMDVQLLVADMVVLFPLQLAVMVGQVVVWDILVAP
jgi:hypothetical protein